MKNFKLLPILLFVIMISSISCDRVDELLTFDLTNEADITIEKTLVPFQLPFDIPTPDITTDSENEFEKNGTKVDLVKNILLKELTGTITSPTGKTFSFLKEIHLYISTNDTDEILLASKTNIDSDATTLELDVTEENLDTYVKASTYKLRTEVVTKETIFQDVDIHIFMKYQVTANL